MSTQGTTVTRPTSNEETPKPMPVTGTSKSTPRTPTTQTTQGLNLGETPKPMSTVGSESRPSSQTTGSTSVYQMTHRSSEGPDPTGETPKPMPSTETSSSASWSP